MVRKKKKKAPVFFTGVYMPREQDVLLKMYAVSRMLSASEAMRRILVSFYTREGITVDSCTNDIVSNLCKEWEAYSLIFRENPDKEISFETFMYRRLKKLPPAITSKIIEKAKYEKNKIQ